MKKLSFVFLFAISLLLGCEQEETTTPACHESAPGSCICNKMYDPVCGCNKKTYSNACMAECVGIMNYTKGACN